MNKMFLLAAAVLVLLLMVSLLWSGVLRKLRA